MDESEVGKPTSPQVSALIAQKVVGGRRIGEGTGIIEADSRVRGNRARVTGFVGHIGAHQIDLAAAEVVDAVNAGGTGIEPVWHVHDVPSTRAAPLKIETVIHRTAVHHAVHVARSGNDES